jgi:hypothetical protein
LNAAKYQIYDVDEPEEFKPREKDLNMKLKESENNLTILKSTVDAMKRQKELSNQLSQSFATIGHLFLSNKSM